MPLLETRNLTAFYGDFQALYGIDMTLENRHRAVTLVSTACSGADVTGLFMDHDARARARHLHPGMTARRPTAHHGVRHLSVELDRVGGRSVAHGLHPEDVALSEQIEQCAHASGLFVREPVDQFGCHHAAAPFWNDWKAITELELC